MANDTQHDARSWASDLEGYIRQGEPDQAQKGRNWATAIGLQAVDGLSPSRYLLDTAKEHIEGRLTIGKVQELVESYYERSGERTEEELQSEEADIVSSRITEILGERSFSFSPATLRSIHGRLFKGLIKDAGTYRTYNISKKEWVLKGESVLYAPWELVGETLDYDFDRETAFSYEGMSRDEISKHIAEFTSDIWQVHPFCEGNTRTTAVFIIKYLNSLGIDVDNAPFEEHSWYFRNALVRANYDDYPKGIRATTEFLERFFENLLLGAHNDLKNRYMHVDYGALEKDGTVLSASSAFPKCKSCTLNCTLGELAVLRLIADNPRITQKDLAAVIGISERTVKTRTVELQAKGLLQRVGGRRNGEWVIPSAIRGEIDAAR